MSAQFENDTIELKGLDQLIKALKVKAPFIKIGILGSNARRPSHGAKKATTNAIVGAVHEFGSPARGIPQRSFLRIPISENLSKELESSGLLDKEKLSQVIASGSLLPWITTVARVAEGVVDDAFENSGPGWPAWKKQGYTNEGGMLLVDSGQLRQSITSEVES